MNKNKTIIGLAMLSLILGGVGVHYAKAIQSFFSIYSSATATTTVSFMQPGKATSTYTLANDTTFGANEQGVDNNYIFVQLVASSTMGTATTTFQWSFEFSNNNIDWFGEDLVAIPVYSIQATDATNISTISHATSTVIHQLVPKSFFPDNGTPSALASTTLRAIKLPDIAAQYKRVRFFLPAGSGNGSVWIQDVAKKQAAGY